MNVMRAVYVSPDEAEAGVSALDYYLDTLTNCTIHEEGEHGDERSCDGWGPQGKADLDSLVKKLRRAL